MAQKMKKGTDKMFKLPDLTCSMGWEIRFLN